MQVKRIGVVGGGTMGQSIAEMLASQGLDVVLVEKTQEKLDHAWEMINYALDKRLEKWAITEAEKKVLLAKIHRTLDIGETASCQLVIETIHEDMEAKKEVFRELDRICPPPAILASNTSTLSLTELAETTRAPERVIGLHFIYPVSKIQLVEIIRAVKTSEETYAGTRRFVEETIQKKGILVYESPGYVTTRLICTLINEAMHTLAERVASAEDIDAAMRIGYSFGYGPLELADRFGLDSVLAALDRMFHEFGDIKYRPSFLLKQMVRAGRLGTKTGEGFFRYDKDGDRV
ncbi:3-hydroxybutyryl-CoA dehydrogenase [Gordoniibacillus kamchatkensis]|uniref:3-hydroxybutyryl-CoA dehydrogenase n=1 Tax=Gordoniibacillus kamchatkensis TaxID=1590651 RepID=A0ABR5AGA7_9BACL|nr:3-hydroxyacyl-CoA dehydrogenase NAD-binding domain-containing protein [Paenibacillus sp. VKM B-2647]KIL40037.1 3-hydroxybutyryl-CoA dehydrogenase [Paenibacillus sp. VKM B-2647]